MGAKKKERRKREGKKQKRGRKREREREGERTTQKERLTTPYARVKENKKGRGEREGERGSEEEMGFNDDDSVEGGGNAVDHRDTGLIRSEPRSPIPVFPSFLLRSLLSLCSHG